MNTEKSFNFESQTRDGIAYNWDVNYHNSDNGFFRNPSFYLAPQANEYKTYGDGMTQHSTAWAVSCEYYTDYIFSLAVYLQNNPKSVETVARNIGRDYSMADINFYSALVYNQDKKTFYNVGDRKKSSSEKYQYDTRWQEVPSWADGSAFSVFRLMTASFFGTIERFNLIENIRYYMDYAYITDEQYRHMLGFVPSEGFNRYARQAQDAINSITDGWLKTNHGLGQLDCLKNNITNSKTAVAA